MTYGNTRRFDAPLDELEPRVRTALAERGFGILTEIDVAATLREKLGIDREPYRILGACNPTLANQAIEAEPDVGLLLPCNVILYRDGEETVVSFVDPHAMLGVATAEGLDHLADEAAALLGEALAAV